MPNLGIFSLTATMPPVDELKNFTSERWRIVIEGGWRRPVLCMPEGATHSGLSTLPTEATQSTCTARIRLLW